MNSTAPPKPSHEGFAGIPHFHHRNLLRHWAKTAPVEPATALETSTIPATKEHLHEV